MYVYLIMRRYAQWNCDVTKGTLDGIWSVFCSLSLAFVSFSLARVCGFRMNYVYYVYVYIYDALLSRVQTIHAIVCRFMPLRL